MGKWVGEGRRGLRSLIRGKKLRKHICRIRILCQNLLRKQKAFFRPVPEKILTCLVDIAGDPFHSFLLRFPGNYRINAEIAVDCFSRSAHDR